MRLGQFIKIRNVKKPDFWLQSRGSSGRVGRILYGDTVGPGRQAKVKYHWPVKVREGFSTGFITTLLRRLRTRGAFERLSMGTLNLVHVRKKDVEGMGVGWLAGDTYHKMKRQPELFRELDSMIGRKR